MKKQLKSEERKLLQLEEELTSKAATASSVQNRFAYKMRGALVESCPEKYLITTTDGSTVKNWHAINRDSKRLEKICKGKVPESAELLQLLSEEADLDAESSELARKTTSVRNPYKRLWQERGVRWPSATSTTSSSSPSPYFIQSTTSSPSPSPYFNQSSVVGVPQKECEVDLFYKQQDDYVLNLAIKESLKTATCAATRTQCGDLALNLVECEESIPRVPECRPSREVCEEERSWGLSLLVDAVNLINQ